MMWPAEASEAQAWIRQRLAEFDFTGRAGDIPFRPPSGTPRPAAVLVPLVWHAAEPSVLLTRRTDHLSQHAGQVSFPGGKIDPQDANACAAALREAREEIGLDARHVQLLGTLPDYMTITSYQVTPVVGLLLPPLALTPAPGEVAEIFEVPLALALDVTRYQRHAYQRDGISGHYLSLTWQQHTIWGATAAMLRLLAAALCPPPR